jgi:hypothetical protein
MAEKEMLTFDISPTALAELKKLAKEQGISIKKTAQKLLYEAMWPEYYIELRRRHGERVGLNRFIGNAERTLTLEEKREYPPPVLPRGQA